MSEDFEQRRRELLGSGAYGAELAERLSALDVEEAEAASPIYPDEGDVPLEDSDARDLAQQFRALRDQHLGDVVAPLSALPAPPGRVAAALMREAEVRGEGLTVGQLRASGRELAEAMVDLQSFRPDSEAAAIRADATTPEGIDATDRLLTARAAVIAWIREDPTVVGNRTAIRDLELRIGDGRRALDAVNSRREKQAIGILGLLGVAAVAVIAIVALILIQLLT